MGDNAENPHRLSILHIPHAQIYQDAPFHSIVETTGFSKIADISMKNGCFRKIFFEKAQKLYLSFLETVSLNEFLDGVSTVMEVAGG